MCSASEQLFSPLSGCAGFAGAAYNFGAPLLVKTGGRCCSKGATSFENTGAVSVDVVVGSDVGVRKTSTVTSKIQQRTAQSLRAVLLVDGCYKSDPKVSIAVSAIANLDGSVLKPGVQITIGVAMRGRPALSKTATLRSKGGAGWFGTFEVDVPVAWFSATTNSTASVTVGLAGAKEKGVGDVTVHAYAEPSGDDFGPAKQRLTLVFPHHSLFPGDEVAIDVVAHTTLVVKSYGIDLKVDNRALEITGVEAIPSKSAKMQWTSKVGIVEGYAVTNAYRCALCNTVPDERGGNEEVLMRLKVKVRGGVAAGAYTVRATVVDDKNKDSNKAMSSADTGAPALMQSRGSVTRDGIGTLHVTTEAPRGIFSSVGGKSLIVNTAVLSGNQLSRRVYITEVSSKGKTRTLSSATGLTCESSDKAVMQVSSDCLQATLTGVETRGAGKVGLMYTAGSFKVDQHFRVYYPEKPIAVKLSQTKALKRVDGWRVPSVVGKCSAGRVSKFQSVSYNVVAKFQTDTSSDAFEADVTQFVKEVSLKTPSVAALVTRKVGSVRHQTVEGKEPGTSQLIAYGADDSVLGETTVTVSNDNVTIVALQAVAVKTTVGVEATTTVENTRSSTEMCASAAKAPAVLSFERDKAQVVALAKLSDGNTMHITRDDGLHLESVDNRSVVIDDDVYVMVPVGGESSPYKSQATAFLVPACAVEPLVEACVLFTVQLPRADECRVTPTQPRLAALDSTASAAGVSTEVSLEITLVWKKPARELSVQSDERTLVDLSKAGGRLNLQRSATGMKLTVAKGATAGPATVVIYFSNQKVNATFTVTVVEFDHFEVPVAAWPTWASSANFDELGGATELSEIECTRPLKFEQATVGCDVILTDGTKIAGLESRGASPQEQMHWPHHSGWQQRGRHLIRHFLMC